MTHKKPILLSFYALSNGDKTIVMGQVTQTPISDLSFKDYNRAKTFRTLFRLYQTRPYGNQEITLVFDSQKVSATTNSYGAFYLQDIAGLNHATLKQVVLPGIGEAKIITGLYDLNVHHFNSATVVVSDIDDTLVHSYIYRKLHKFKTLMFTAMEKRKAVTNMQDLIAYFTSAGAEPVYLSNSEQNLYPIIYRFLQHNNFPRGPLFLKQLRSLWDVIRNIKFPLLNVHKTTVLEDLLNHFPDKRFVLMGDNTQNDLAIYLSVASKYPKQIRCIIIRKVVEKANDKPLLDSTAELLKANNIDLYYSDKLDRLIFGKPVSPAQPGM
jgi:phosphatidate phosphatase APP1